MSAITHPKDGFTHGLSLRTLECPRFYGNTCVLFTSQLRYSAGVFQALWLTDIIVFAAPLHVTDSYSIWLSFGFWCMSMKLHVAWSSVPSRYSNQCWINANWPPPPPTHQHPPPPTTHPPTKRSTFLFHNPCVCIVSAQPVWQGHYDIRDLILTPKEKICTTKPNIIVVLFSFGDPY